ncbi:Chaperone dnaK2 [Paramuricea clavata]|uniref:Chaperone dnaK2 n=1 Tax=Paramuricea clavata TaxID=317549 RepID=A0A6S7ILG3_PARCT|nr:Chaperone dnaK2 [Paramuricea clavata]
MACNRSTLCQVEGSFLASMFSGRWENQQKKDKDGNVFLNFDPGYFKLILKFLRSKELSIPEYPPPVPVPAKDDFPHFYNLVNYLGLREEFKVKKVDTFCDPCVSNISISDEDTVIKFGYNENSLINNDTGRYVLGYKCCESGRTQWRLEAKQGSIFIGVFEYDSDGVSNADTHTGIWLAKGANGWTSDLKFQNGNPELNESFDSICADVIHILTLDLDAMTLSLANGRGVLNMKLQRVKDPEDDCYCWSLCIGFLGDIQNEVRLAD